MPLLGRESRGRDVRREQPCPCRASHHRTQSSERQDGRVSEVGAELLALALRKPLRFTKVPQQNRKTNPVFSPGPLLSSCPPRLCPLSFGEGVEFDPLPPKEIRYTSSVKYDSEKHFIDDIYMPVGLSVSSCSQTVVCVPNCTWRSYKAEVRFEPRNKPLRFTSTTIVYPKHAKTVYTTTLDYNCRKSLRRFLSSVELETSESLASDCVLDGC
nr:PREDICTED: filamin-interacting protein FAM101B [Apteryx mantelli mantelli]